jgi:hypothetical protein
MSHKKTSVILFVYFGISSALSFVFSTQRPNSEKGPRTSVDLTRLTTPDVVLL